MGNHYHLLTETPKGNLASGMWQVNVIYAQAFNCCHERPDHLFQGRYKAILIEKDRNLLAEGRYILLNLLAAGMVEAPEHWPWSGYQATVSYVCGV